MGRELRRKQAKREGKSLVKEEIIETHQVRRYIIIVTAIVAVVVLVLLLPTFKLMNKINPSAFLKEALEDEEDEEDEINENE